MRLCECITHDEVPHDVSLRAHPARHLGCLHERLELGVRKEARGWDSGAVGGVPCRVRGILPAKDGLLNATLDAIRTNDEIAVDDFAGGQGDRGRLGVAVDDSRVETELHLVLGEVVQELVEVGTVDVIVGRTEGVHALRPARVRDHLAIAIPAEDEGLRIDGDFLELLAETPANEEAGDVGRHLDACTDLADRGRGLEEGDPVSGLRKTVCGSEATEAAAYDEDVQLEGGFAVLRHVCVRWRG